MAEEIFAYTNLFYGIYRQGFIIHWNPFYRMFNHPGEFIIHNQLAIIDCHAHFDHSQTVYQVGTCQRW